MLAHGDVRMVEAKRDTLRVVCFTPIQVETLLKVTGIMSIPVKITRPWSHQKKPAEPKPFRGVILNVDLDIAEEEIVEETCALTAKRIMRMEAGVPVPTTTVALTFATEPPKDIRMGFMRYRVCHYIPTPIRCGRCQRFGHPTSVCHSKQPRCVRCGEAHSFDDCPKKEEGQQARCANCGGNHSAAYRGCRRYQEVREALKIVGRERVSYADAVKRQKEETKKMAAIVAAAPVDPPKTPSTVVPSPAAGSYAAVATTPPQAKQSQVVVAQKQKAMKQQQKPAKSSTKATAPVATTSTTKPAATLKTKPAITPSHPPPAPTPVDDRLDKIIDTLNVIMSILLQVVKKNPTAYEMKNLAELTKSVTELKTRKKEATAAQSSSSSSASSTPADQSAVAQPAADQ